jgi:hypothetical protein
MGLSGALRTINWPAVVSGSIHVLSTASLVVISKIAMDSFAFPFPATLTLLHHSGIAAALWFWTLFGLFRPRRLPLLPAARLAAGAALCAVLSMLSLRYNSLAVYQAIRMSAAPTAFAIERGLRNRPTRLTAATDVELEHSRSHVTQHQLQQRLWRQRRGLLAIAFVCIVVLYVAVVLLTGTDPAFTNTGAVCGLASSLSTAIYQAWSRPARESAKGNELQLQLYTKTLGALSILPLLPILDNYSLRSRESIFRVHISESTAITLLATTLLAFLSFVAMRVSISRTSPQFYRALVSAVSILIFTADLEIHRHAASFGKKACIAIVFMTWTALAHCRQSIVSLEQRMATSSASPDTPLSNYPDVSASSTFTEHTPLINLEQSTQPASTVNRTT